jgi:hypothetical protein
LPTASARLTARTFAPASFMSRSFPSRSNMTTPSGELSNRLRNFSSLSRSARSDFLLSVMSVNVPSRAHSPP